jgi:hypothetical protein
MQSVQSIVKTSKKVKRDTQQEPKPEQTPEQTSEPKPEPTQEIRLVDIPINNENTALNVMVGFLNVAHKRGSFTIDETAKIWECISKFQKM